MAGLSAPAYQSYMMGDSGDIICSMMGDSEWGYWGYHGLSDCGLPFVILKSPCFYRVGVYYGNLLFFGKYGDSDVF